MTVIKVALPDNVFNRLLVTRNRTGVGVDAQIRAALDTQQELDYASTTQDS